MEIEIVLKKLASPARRAIIGSGVTTLEELAQMSEDQVAALHGIGKNVLSVIRAMLEEHGLSFTLRPEE